MLRSSLTGALLSHLLRSARLAPEPRPATSRILTQLPVDAAPRVQGQRERERRLRQMAKQAAKAGL